ncbi:SDR family oxidoreductase [Actinomyces bowdenii]|uniref:SDR family oxidoreductase n=1 Tax=Actinomyces bowdenii TaxID=131109 RepID=A0A853EP97_9ACTO|nr:SDR family oxidoreductase [Actinomyces bowdenii]MBF0698118.1 SDR family oxidoreductase [Actinomyces bowdenii]MDO5064699.1 SDR family oxidoreductase [Actinomyces bowdenii]NYS70290.1 SDR family oxidoreductase [Actinomyces bowdenii]
MSPHPGETPAIRSGRRRRGNEAAFTPAFGFSAASTFGRHQRRPVALVTGATSGIGLAVARDLARDHNIILIARTVKDLEELAAALEEESRAAVLVCPVDLTNDTAVTRTMGRLQLDSLDVLVHCAGVEATGAVDRLTPARWRAVLDLDLVAVAHLTSLLLPALREARGLAVFVNSGAGLRSSPGNALYSAAKAGLKALADTLREEERGKVRVTSIYPGRVDTPMQERLHALKAARLRTEGQTVPAYRAADHMTPQSVASAVRLAVSTSMDAVVEDLAIRPSGML